MAADEGDDAAADEVEVLGVITAGATVPGVTIVTEPVAGTEDPASAGAVDLEGLEEAVSFAVEEDLIGLSEVIEPDVAGAVSRRPVPETDPELSGRVRVMSVFLVSRRDFLEVLGG